MLDPRQRMAVNDLIVASAMAVDRDDLEGWLDCFDGECSYTIMPRENRERNYAVGLISCPTRAILTDRIVVLRKASKFNPHYDRHILGGTQILGVNGSLVRAETNFAVIQTTKEGVSKLFCAGCYEDRINLTGEAPKLKERVVLLDTFAVPNLIATPL